MSHEILSIFKIIFGLRIIDELGTVRANSLQLKHRILRGIYE